VADADGRLVGRVGVCALVAANPRTQIQSMMDDGVRTVSVDQSDEDAAKILVHYALVSVPVVDDLHRLVGVITISDAMDLFAPRAWRTRPRSTGD
jgi:magnesium transporter